MKLLFDENLSPQLARRLADLFPDSLHVRDVGLNAAADPSVWDYAKDHNFMIVSKDADMHDLVCCSVLRRQLSGCAWEIARPRK